MGMTCVSILFVCHSVTFAAFPIASYCATPAAVPASRTFGYDITVPLFYNGQNVGSTVIPKGPYI